MKGNNFDEKEIKEPKEFIHFNFIVLISITGLLVFFFFYLCEKLLTIMINDSRNDIIVDLKEAVENLINSLENAGDGVSEPKLEDIFNLIDRVISCLGKISEKYPQAINNNQFPNREGLMEFLRNLHVIQLSNLNYSKQIISCGREYLPELRKVVALFTHAIEMDWAIQMD